MGLRDVFFGVGGGMASDVVIIVIDHTSRDRRMKWGVNPMAKAWQRANLSLAKN